MLRHEALLTYGLVSMTNYAMKQDDASVAELHAEVVGHSRGVSIRRFEEEDADRWDAFVAGHPNATSYHLCRWTTLISNTFGHEGHYWLAELDDHTIVGILPTVRLKSRLFGDFIVSMPYFTYGGVLATDASVGEQLMGHACDHANSIGVAHIEFRDIQARSKWQHVRTDKVTMLLPLPGTEEELWASLSSERRNRIKKSQKSGASTTVGGIELVPDFYQVFARNMRDLGTPVYSIEFFRRMLAEFPHLITVLVTRFQDRPVAAAVLIHHPHSTEVPWVSSVSEFNHMAFNILLYWECLRVTIRSGRRAFDFGRSTVGSGTYTFKKRWGAAEKQLYWHYWLRGDRRMPNLTPHNPKYQLAVHVWQRLPLFVTNALGPRIVKNLP